ncbi:MAG: medium chain dehydrogenase/reductase family protein [Gammaproteobacteria bacterium]|nr:medium chain dehydrogenase/reductase family protein [Gammaproteobacteria bacterium]
MRKIVIKRPGGFKQLRIEEHPDPQPGPGEVAIDVEAIGVNFADCITRMGLYASANQFVGFPITPGFEVAGRVAEVGEGVTDILPGEPVLAVDIFNMYATRVVVKRQNVFAKPAEWSMAEAAGFPAVFLTAWYALFELAHPKEGAQVLVHSAAGGVGQALVQLAKVAGCGVTGVVGGAHKVDAVKALGVERVIDKSSEDLWKKAASLVPGGYDLILDANGIATLKQSYAHLTSGGKLIIYGFHTMFSKNRGKPNWIKMAVNYLRTPRFNPMRLTQENKSVMAFNLSFMGHRLDILQKAMGELLVLAATGELRPLLVTTYSFDDVQQAHRDLESGETVGKLVLTTT